MPKTPSKPLHVYVVDDGWTTHYVATSARAALTMHAKAYDPKATIAQYRQEYPEVTVEPCKDSAKLTISIEAYNGADFDLTQTMSAWAKRNGPGFLCSTIW